MTPQIKVDIKLISILIGADESFLKLELPNNFKIVKFNFSDFPYKNKIIDSNGDIILDYHFAKIEQVIDNRKNINFICLTKEDYIYVDYPEVKKNQYISLDKFSIDKAIDNYSEESFKDIDCILSKFMLFKEGNIIVKNIYYTFNYTLLFNNTKYKEITISDANTLVIDKYTLIPSNIPTINKYLNSNNEAFSLCKGLIDSFTYSYKLTSNGKTLEQLITVCEMIFLTHKDTKGKKKCLSKRMAVFIGTTDNEIYRIYSQMKNYYKLRSNSTHEGVDYNISYSTIKGLREYTRKSINKLLDFSNKNLVSNPSLSFSDIKKLLVKNLKELVNTNSSVFSANN